MNISIDNINDIVDVTVKKNPGHHPLGNKTDAFSKLFQCKSKKDEIMAAIGRDLTFFEYDMLAYPRLCMTCLSGIQVLISTFNNNKITYNVIYFRRQN